MGLKDVARRLNEPSGEKDDPEQKAQYGDVRAQEAEDAFDSPMMIMNQIHEA
jgi:hypothetical protein